MKFSTVAFFTSMAATVFAAPTVVKRDDAPAAASPLGGLGGLGGVTGLLAVIAPVQTTVEGLLGGLTPGASPADVTNIVQQVTGQLGGLQTTLGGLTKLTDLSDADKQTIAQKVAGLANQVTGALSNVESVLGNAAPQLKGPLTQLNTMLQGTLNAVTGLVNGLNGILTPLLQPVTGVLASLGVGNLLPPVGLLGL